MQAMKKPKFLNKSVLSLTGLFLGESAVFANVVAQISTSEEVHQQVKVVSVLEGIIHIHKERIRYLRENLAFVENRFNAALRYYSCFAHLLHRKRLFRLLLSHAPNFAEPTFSDAVGVTETVLSDS